MKRRRLRMTEKTNRRIDALCLCKRPRARRDLKLFPENISCISFTRSPSSCSCRKNRSFTSFTLTFPEIEKTVSSTRGYQGQGFEGGLRITWVSETLYGLKQTRRHNMGPYFKISLGKISQVCASLSRTLVVGFIVLSTQSSRLPLVVASG